MNNIKVSVIGAAGYTGSELLRLLINHPNVEIVSAVSQSQKGKKIYSVFQDLLGETELQFTDTSSKEADLIYMCLPHGEAKIYIEANPSLIEKKIIDLSRDFRWKDENTINHAEFIYGLPELNKEQISTASYIANPGCFATAIQLGLLPLAKHNLLKHNIQTTATTGSTGAGIKHTDTTHFSWRHDNLSIYEPFTHAHNQEIKESLQQLQKDMHADFVFIPQRGSFTRGIFATTLVETDQSLEKLVHIYTDFYAESKFTFLVQDNIDLKMVINTNKCLIQLKKHNNNLLITSIIDNLIKGAAGQAVHNMNLMFGLDEQTGLKLKSSIY